MATRPTRARTPTPTRARTTISVLPSSVPTCRASAHASQRLTRRVVRLLPQIGGYRRGVGARAAEAHTRGGPVFAHDGGVPALPEGAPGEAALARGDCAAADAALKDRLAAVPAALAAQRRGLHHLRTPRAGERL